MLPRLCQFGYGDELGLDCTGIPPLIQLEPSSSNSAKKVGKAVLLAPPESVSKFELEVNRPKKAMLRPYLRMMRQTATV